MSMKDFNDAVALMETAPNLMGFMGPRDPALVAAAEAAIGSRFPPTYRAFVARYGAGGFGGFEIYGVTGANFNSGPIPNGIWATLDDRRSGYLPSDLLVVGDDGMGGLYCIELRNGAEGRVIVYGGDGTPPGEREFIANDFGEFLLSEVREVLEDDDESGDG